MTAPSTGEKRQGERFGTLGGGAQGLKDLMAKLILGTSRAGSGPLLQTLVEQSIPATRGKGTVTPEGTV